MTKAMRTRHILCMLLTTAALSSCVRDEIEPCPPLQVNITVKDKNYFNVDKVELEERLPEDLAFREYIPTLHYTLRDAATGEVVEEPAIHTPNALIPPWITGHTTAKTAEMITDHRITTIGTKRFPLKNASASGSFL